MFKTIALLVAFYIQSAWGFTPPQQQAFQVASTAVLAATATTSYPNGVWRADFGPGIGAVPLWFLPKPGNCASTGSINDGGSCINASNGGSWHAVFDPAGFTAQQFGTIGDGIHDDTSALQAASNAAAAAGVPLLFDAKHLYSITSPITIANPVKWSGLYRYGAWAVNQPDASLPQFCPWGIVNKTGSGFNLVTATALTGTIDGVCFDGTGTTAIQATAGEAISISPTSGTTFSAGWRVENNTLTNIFDGITVDGAGGYICCGQGAGATDPGVIANNTLTNLQGWAIALGRNTANGDTSNITVSNNIIICNPRGLTPLGSGMLIADGSITVDATQVGPIGCRIGFALTPGVIAGGHGQAVNGNFKGQLGSFNTQHDILIQPTGPGSIVFANFESQVFAGNAFETGAPEPIYIDCSGITSGGGCEEIAFTGLQTAVGIGATNAFHVVAGPFGPISLSIVGSSLCHGTGDNQPNSSALRIDFTQGPIPGGSFPPGHFVFSGNRIGQGCEGDGFANAITLNMLGTPTPPYGDILIANNDLSGATNPIAYTPSAGGVDHVIIQNNLGIDTQTGSVASAATITLPAAVNIAGITGTTAVNTINGAWINRAVTLVPASSGLTFNTGGNICNSVTTTAAVPIIAQWQFGFSCWSLK